MSGLTPMTRARIALAWLVLVPGAVAPARAQNAASSPLAGIDGEIAAAERALAEDERQLAESRYRGALYAGWMMLGSIAAADGRFTDARDAYGRASAAVVDAGDAQQALAMVHLQLDDAKAALPILTRLVAARPGQPALRRLYAQALIAAKQPAEAVQILEEAHGAAPDDLETIFALATGYLRVKKADAARPLFARLAAARPRPETHVLIGRAYRDAGLYPEARTALTRAIALNPRVRRAHYYLGTAAVMEEGIVKVDEAIAHFRRELAIAPGDPSSTLLLGMALVEARREREALPLLEAAARDPGAGWRTFQYLGRTHLALGRGREAVDALRKAIALSADVPVDSRIGNQHYQLAQALRLAGETEAAEAEFARAASAAAARAEHSRDSLQRYFADGERAGAELPQFALDTGALGKTSADERRAARARAATALARVYLNLGVMQAQAGRFGRAADLMQSAAALDPALPRLQYSLGVACFNAQQYGAAAAALERALAEEPANADARRMLALASLNTRAFPRAVELLRDDPELTRTPSLQYAYGVALVHSGHAAEGEALFTKLIASHTDNAELNVLLGQAHAEQGDFEGAVAALTRALALKPGVADASRTLGQIYMKQGRFADAAAALKAAVAAHPGDLAARHTLATVLDLDGRQAEALEALAAVLQARPDDADARYLVGKILLARGSALEAIEQLEVAARLAPEDANVRYQLGQGYQKLGRTADAQREFETFQQLKDKRRGGGA